VLYAFGPEGERIAGQMENVTEETWLGRTVKKGDLAGRPIILAESGIGMTNAAMSTQKLIDIYEPRAVIMTGIAGALDSAVNIGDVVICDRWVQHDYVYASDEGSRHRVSWVYSPGQDSIVGIGSFPVDSTLMSVARRLRGREMGLGEIEGRPPRLHVGGTGVSGNAFVDSKEKRREFVSQFGAMIVDMESTAVMQVCYVNGVPALVFRSASDLAGGSGKATAREEMNRFFEIAADNSAAILEAFFEEM
jgi:adenosylhomocysteine nucleosidase